MGCGASATRRVHFAGVVPVPSSGHMHWRKAVEKYQTQKFPLHEAMELAWPHRRGPSWYSVACTFCKRRDLDQETYVGLIVLGLYIQHDYSSLKKRREMFLNYLNNHNHPDESQSLLMRFEYAFGFYDVAKSYTPEKVFLEMP